MKPKILVIGSILFLTGCQILFVLGFLYIQFVRPEETRAEQALKGDHKKHEASVKNQRFEWYMLHKVEEYAEDCVFEQLEKGSKEPYLGNPLGKVVDKDDPSIVHVSGLAVYYPDSGRATKWFRAKFKVTKNIFGKKNWESLECSLMNYEDRYKEQ